MGLTRLFLLFGCALLTACSSSFESEFKEGCRNFGGNRSFCTCSYNKVEKHYGEDQLEQIKESWQFPEDWADQVQRAGFACMAKLK